jgi:threonine synthase
MIFAPNATAARDESEGLIEAVTDDQILEAYQLLARKEGLFVEPASAACVAGLLKKARAGQLRAGRGVCVLTGHGLKDPETASAIYTPDLARADSSVAGIERALGL